MWKGQQKKRQGEAEPYVSPRSLHDTHSQEACYSFVPQVGIKGEGPLLHTAGEGEISEYYELLERLQGLFSFPSPGTVAFAGTVPPHLSSTVRGGQRST